MSTVDPSITDPSVTDRSGTDRASPGSAPSAPSAPSTPSTPKPSVIFVREWDQQLSSSGCCGRVEGDFLGTGTVRERVFSERRECMQQVGILYRALRDRFGDDVEIRILDPRNLISLVPILWREGRRHGVPVSERLGVILRVSVNMLIVNGRIVARERWPSSSELLDRVSERSSTAPRRA